MAKKESAEVLFQRDLHRYIVYRLQRKYGQVKIVSLGQSQQPRAWKVVCPKCLPGRLQTFIKYMTLTFHAEVQSNNTGRSYAVLAGQCETCGTVYFVTFRRL